MEKPIENPAVIINDLLKEAQKYIEEKEKRQADELINESCSDTHL